MLLLPRLTTLLLMCLGGVSTAAAMFVVPTSWLVSLLPRVSLALLATQLVQGVPLVDSLLSSSSSLARSIVSTSTLLLTLLCAPSSLLTLYSSAIDALGGPLLGALSAAVWLECVTYASRFALILGFCFLCYAVSARWFYVSALLASTEWSVGAVATVVVLLLLAAYVSIRSVVAPRAVLSESAIVLLLVSLSLQSWLRARLEPEQLRVWRGRDVDSWLLEHALPMLLDGLALVLLTLVLQARLADSDATDLSAQHRAVRASSSSKSSSGSGVRSAASSHLYRAAGVVVLTFLLQWLVEQKGAVAATWVPDSIASVLPASVADNLATWGQQLADWTNKAAGALLSTFAAVMSSSGASENTGDFTAQLAALAATVADSLPRGCWLLLRAVVALACSFRFLEGEEEQWHQHDD